MATGPTVDAVGGWTKSSKPRAVEIKGKGRLAAGQFELKCDYRRLVGKTFSKSQGFKEGVRSTSYGLGPWATAEFAANHEEEFRNLLEERGLGGGLLVAQSARSNSHRKFCVHRHAKQGKKLSGVRQAQIAQ